MSWDVVAAIGQVAGAIATAVGLLLIFKQLQIATRTASATFVFQLENEFSDHLWDLYRNFLPGGSWAIDATVSPTVEESIDIEKYANYFDSLEVRGCARSRLLGRFLKDFLSSRTASHSATRHGVA